MPGHARRKYGPTHVTRRRANSGDVELRFAARRGRTVAYLAANVPTARRRRCGKHAGIDLERDPNERQASADPGDRRDAVHVNAYFGDVGRNGRYDSFDVQQVRGWRCGWIRVFSSIRCSIRRSSPTSTATGGSIVRRAAQVAPLAVRLPVTAAPGAAESAADNDRHGPFVAEGPPPEKTARPPFFVPTSTATARSTRKTCSGRFTTSIARRTGEVPAEADGKKLDVNGDDQFDAADILFTITDLNAQPRSTEGELDQLAGFLAADAVAARKETRSFRLRPFCGVARRPDSHTMERFGRPRRPRFPSLMAFDLRHSLRTRRRSAAGDRRARRRASQAASKHQVLLGVTGSGKTFTMANVIQAVQRPTLVLSHNKTLAAQLYGEFKEFFPHNAVHYFVSYYDYYQPEAYIPQRDIYIEKDASINEEIDRLRLAATSALVSRRDVIIVASVSCIYGLGSPEDYKRDDGRRCESGETIDRDELLLQAGRHPVRAQRHRVRARQVPRPRRLRRGLAGLRRIRLPHRILGRRGRAALDHQSRSAARRSQPQRRAVHLPGQALRHAGGADRRRRSTRSSRNSNERLEQFRNAGQAARSPAADRPHAVRHRNAAGGRLLPGHRELQPAAVRPASRASRPTRCSTSSPNDFLLFVDESHVTVPQVRAMFAGDRSRKTTLVEHGFRLPSALDNRPLKFDEWEAEDRSRWSSSRPRPAPYELEQTGGEVVEQVIRPTGLLDPVIEVSPGPRPGAAPARSRSASGPPSSERVLVTTLTKRLAEDLSAYLSEQGVALQVAAQRTRRLRARRTAARTARGQFDALVGVNLLREGLDLPEVSLVAILDADKEGFLRSETSLIQTIGRAARNVNAEVILYADKVTDSMQRAIDETSRRRELQEAVQRRARHHAGDDQEERSARASKRKPPPIAQRNAAVGRSDERSTSPRNISTSWKPRCSPPPRRWSSNGRPPSATASCS